MEGREGNGELLRLVAGELCIEEGSPASGKGRSSSGMCNREEGLAEDLAGTDESINTKKLIVLNLLLTL